MDLALAYHVAAGAAPRTARSSTPARCCSSPTPAGAAKEQLFADPKLATAPVTVLGKGQPVIGGTIKDDLPRADVEKVLVDGFFPECPRDAEPAPARAGGLAGTRPALRRRPGGHASTWRSSCAGRPRRWRTASRPAARRRRRGDAARCRRRCCSTAACSRRDPLRNRLLGRARTRGRRRRRPTRSASWPGADLDLAVARGAAYYGLVRRGKGVRIRGGTARAYYVGVETALPAVPGLAAAAEGAVRGPVRHGGGDRGGRAGPGVRAGGRRGGRVPLPRLDGPPRRRGRARWWRSGRARSTSWPRCATTLEGEGGTAGRVVPVHLHSKVTRGRAAGTVVHQPRRQAAVEAGVQRPRGAVESG